MTWTFKTIDGSVNKEPFDCGNPPLNEYLKKYARQNHESGLGKTYVAVDEGQNVLGFYTISTAQVKSEFLPQKLTKRLPKYPIPAVRIGRLAVDKSMHGCGLGKELLMHAVTIILDISEKVGIFLVVVDAKDDAAVAFYQKYGFVQSPENPKTLFLLLDPKV